MSSAHELEAAERELVRLAAVARQAELLARRQGQFDVADLTREVGDTLERAPHGLAHLLSCGRVMRELNPRYRPNGERLTWTAFE